MIKITLFAFCLFLAGTSCDDDFDDELVVLVDDGHLAGRHVNSYGSGNYQNIHGNRHGQYGSKKKFFVGTNSHYGTGVYGSGAYNKPNRVQGIYGISGVHGTIKGPMHGNKQGVKFPHGYKPNRGKYTPGGQFVNNVYFGTQHPHGSQNIHGNNPYKQIHGQKHPHKQIHGQKHPHKKPQYIGQNPHGQYGGTGQFIGSGGSGIYGGSGNQGVFVGGGTGVHGGQPGGVYGGVSGFPGGVHGGVGGIPGGVHGSVGGFPGGIQGGVHGGVHGGVGGVHGGVGGVHGSGVYGGTTQGYKSGSCPQTRGYCPSQITAASNLHPQYCSNDSSCPGIQKCCQDACVQGRLVCKNPGKHH